MNYLAIVRKHLKGIDKAFEGMTPETMKKAGGIIREACIRYEGMALPGVLEKWDPAPSVTFAVNDASSTTMAGGAATAAADAFPGTLGGELAAGVPEVGKPVESKETGFGRVTVSSAGGVTTVFPADYEEGGRGPGAFAHEIEGDTGSTGMFETVTVGGITSLEVEKPVPVEMIGGWPERGVVRIVGLMPNRRHLRAYLEDGRLVTVERRPGWAAGEFKARLVMTGQVPLFRLI